MLAAVLFALGFTATAANPGLGVAAGSPFLAFHSPPEQTSSDPEPSADVCKGLHNRSVDLDVKPDPGQKTRKGCTCT